MPGHWWLWFSIFVVLGNLSYDFNFAAISLIFYPYPIIVSVCYYAALPFLI